MDYTFTLSPDDIQVICNGLGELQLKVAVNTFGKLMAQKGTQDVTRAQKPELP